MFFKFISIILVKEFESSSWIYIYFIVLNLTLVNFKFNK